jgi:hypothetical protein
MTLMQLCLTMKERRLDATAQTTDRSVFRPRSFFSVVRVFVERPRTLPRMLRPQPFLVI